MKLTKEGARLLSKLCHNEIALLLGFGFYEFAEEAGVPAYILSAYLGGECDELREKDIDGLARALSMSPEGLVERLSAGKPNGPACKETQLRTEEMPNTPWALERRCRELFKHGEINEFYRHYNKMKNMCDAGNDISMKVRAEFAKRAADVATVVGQYHYEKLEPYGTPSRSWCGVPDFLNGNLTGLRSAYDDLYGLTQSFPDLSHISYSYMWVASELFVIQAYYVELKNTESYINEVLPLSGRFPADHLGYNVNTKCLKNLFKLCLFDPDISITQIQEILNCIEEIAGRFPLSNEIQLYYMRALTSFLIYGKPRLQADVFRHYYTRTEDAFSEQEKNSDSVYQRYIDKLRNEISAMMSFYAATGVDHTAEYKSTYDFL